MIEEIEILFHCLAKPDAWIHNDTVSSDPGLQRRLHRLAQLTDDVSHQVLVRYSQVPPSKTRFNLCLLGATTIVHQDHGHAPASHQRGHVRISAESPHIVNQVRPGIQGRFGHGRLVRVNRDRDFGLLGQTANHGQDPPHLLLCGHPGRARTSGLATHVQHVGTFRYLPEPLSDRSLDRGLVACLT